MYSVYVIINPKGKKYTGQTVNLDERLEMHIESTLTKASNDEVPGSNPARLGGPQTYPQTTCGFLFFYVKI